MRKPKFQLSAYLDDQLSSGEPWRFWSDYMTTQADMGPGLQSVLRFKVYLNFNSESLRYEIRYFKSIKMNIFMYINPLKAVDP